MHGSDTLHSCDEPNWWKGKRAASKLIWYNSFSLVRQKRSVRQSLSNFCPSWLRLDTRCAVWISCRASVALKSDVGCVRLGDLDVAFKIWISYLQSSGKSETDFNAEISVFVFSFLTIRLEIQKRIWKTVLNNSGLARARVISKEKTAVLQILFRISNRTVKRKSTKSGFGFLNLNPFWGRISRRCNPFSDFAFDCKIRNPDFKI